MSIIEDKRSSYPAVGVRVHRYLISPLVIFNSKHILTERIIFLTKSDLLHGRTRGFIQTLSGLPLLYKTVAYNANFTKYCFTFYHVTLLGIIQCNLQIIGLVPQLLYRGTPVPRDFAHVPIWGLSSTSILMNPFPILDPVSMRSVARRIRAAKN